MGRKRALPCVQRLPWESPKCLGERGVGELRPSVPAVHRIANDWPSARSEVCADLVGTAGDQPALEKREADARHVGLRDPLEMRDARCADML